MHLPEQVKLTEEAYNDRGQRTRTQVSPPIRDSIFKVDKLTAFFL
jgi:hypothetical protein